MEGAEDDDDEEDDDAKVEPFAEWDEDESNE